MSLLLILHFYSLLVYKSSPVPVWRRTGWRKAGLWWEYWSKSGGCRPGDAGSSVAWSVRWLRSEPSEPGVRRKTDVEKWRLFKSWVSSGVHPSRVRSLPELRAWYVEDVLWSALSICRTKNDPSGTFPFVLVKADTVGPDSVCIWGLALSFPLTTSHTEIRNKATRENKKRRELLTLTYVNY